MKTSVETTYNAYINAILENIEGRDNRCSAASAFRIALENLEREVRQSAVSKAYDLANLLAKGE